MLAAAPLPLLHDPAADDGAARSPVERAYRHVLDGILAGDLAPGMHLPTEALAGALGISRMPVRDALRRLEGDGVVVVRANRGAVIAAYARGEVVQLIEMRAALEGLAAAAAVPHCGTLELDELRLLAGRMERPDLPLPVWMARHDDFHNYLSARSGRALLVRQTGRMRLMLRPYFRRYYATSGEREIPGHEHRHILEALRGGDAEAVERVVRAHVLANLTRVAEFA